MRTLYVSDLDGTLLRSDETLSARTCSILNELVSRGMVFSYATARSLNTSRRITRELTAKLPLIVYNGAFIVDNEDGHILNAVYLGEKAWEIVDELIGGGVFPIVYAMVDGRECFSYIPERCSKAALDFIATRAGDPRCRPVHSVEELTRGSCFYITCIDDEAKLAPFAERYAACCHSVYQKDIYSGEQWLELMPLEASKARAIQRLKAITGCERVVVFGDGRNDLDMFAMADEAYAVENAVPELKAAATGVIGHHDEDAVALWLLEHADTAR